MSVVADIEEDSVELDSVLVALVVLDVAGEMVVNGIVLACAMGPRRKVASEQQLGPVPQQYVPEDCGLHASISLDPAASRKLVDVHSSI